MEYMYSALQSRVSRCSYVKERRVEYFTLLDVCSTQVLTGTERSVSPHFIWWGDQGAATATPPFSATV